MQPMARPCPNRMPFQPRILLILLALVLASGSGAQTPEPMGPALQIRSLEGAVQQLELLTDRPLLRAVPVPDSPLDFNTREPMPQSELIMALQSLLSINGIAVVSVGDFLKLVPVAEVQRHSPDLIEGTTLDMQPSLAWYMKQFNFNFLNARTDELEMVRGLMSNPQFIITYPKANSILLTDTLANLQRIERVLVKADRADPDVTELYFFELENVEATEIANQLQSLLLDEGSTISLAYRNNTKIEADDRTNQLILVTHPDNYERLTEIVEKLDIDVEPVTNHLSYYLRHAEEASQVAGILNELIQAQQQAAEDATGRAGRTGANRGGQGEAGGQGNGQQPPRTVEQAAANVARGASPRLFFSDFVNVVADERANAIHATGTENDLRIIEELLEKIDVALPQVRIEVVIADVTLNQGQSSGLDAFNVEIDGDGTIDFPSLDFGPGDNQGLGLSNVNVPIEGDFFDNVSLAASIGFSRTSGDANILSTPTILTQHNKTATIVVAEQRPLITGTTTNDTGTTSSVDFRRVGIELEVTPLIGKNGEIQLEISQSSDDFGDTVATIDGTDQPAIFERQAQSFVSVQSGQTIVLGGLRQRDTDYRRNRLFLLGDLPILGPLFQPEEYSVTETELIIFIRPTVVENPAEVDRLTLEELEDLDETGDTLREYFRTGDFPGPNPPPYDPYKIKELLGINDQYRERERNSIRRVEDDEEPETEPMESVNEASRRAGAGVRGRELVQPEASSEPKPQPKDNVPMLRGRGR